MGGSFSKQDHNTALLLCKDRTRYIKTAIDARYAMSAAHLSHLQSVRNLGTALRHFVETETLTEPSKSPSHSSYASPSVSPLMDLGSPFNGTPSPLQKSGTSCMKAGASAALNVAIDLNKTHFIKDGGEEEETGDLRPSWDFFDTNKSNPNSNPNPNRGEDAEPEFFTPNGKVEAFKHNNEKVKGKTTKPEAFQNRKGNNEKSKGEITKAEDFQQRKSNNEKPKGEITKAEAFNNGKSNNEKPKGEITKAEAFKNRKGNNEKVKGEIEKEEQFITHRAKDLVSSMREIEQRFIKASESGHEVSRMLETRKIRLQICNETIGREENMAKVITWNRSVSSQSSCSRNPLITNSPIKKDNNNSENGSDFIEEFCMISGSHSSTLDRLFAWEKKLSDELKASEAIRKAYDQKCMQLRHQFAKDFDVRIIDKTRANVKDLYSRLMVAIQAVDSISRRIEKLREDELQPQLVELLQGLTRMWKAMLETYHTQQITMSLAYNTKDHTALATSDPKPDPQIISLNLTHLKTEMECFNSTFSNWIKTHKTYIESLNSWLQKCILQPQERSRGRKITFSPRRAIAPPIFVLLRDWSNGVLAMEELLSEGFESVKKVCLELSEREEGRLEVLQKGLVGIFEEKRGFCEKMVKVLESVKEEGERAREAYSGFG